MSIEDIEEEHVQHKAIAEKASRVLELADESEDDEDDKPIVVDGDTEINDLGGEETPSESVEAELGK